MISNKPQALRTALILVFSSALVVGVSWFAPALSAASLNMLFRLRGALKAPADVVIVAIDDSSLQRIGQWPWPRTVMAEVLDNLTKAQPRSIGLDIIYAEPSTPEADQRLADALARNGRVVLPAQLYETAAHATAWLQPLPVFARAAKAIGHAHVSPEVDGMARSIQLSKANDRADRLWAFGLEVVRVAEDIAPNAGEELPGVLRLGTYRIPVRDEATGSALPGVSIVRPNEMLINYIGPAGSFAYVSLADVLDGTLPPATFTGKIVLIGAVADSMGDSRVAPFMHYNAGRREGGQEMPGIEIHANIINTMRGHLSFRSLPDWLAFAIALAVIVLAALTIRWLDGWRQLATLGALLFVIVGGSLLAFNRYLLVPPLVPMLTGFVAVIPLLLNRSLAASRELDIKLAALVSSQQGFLPATTPTGSNLAPDFADAQLGLDLPQSLAWKLRAVDDLTARMLARMNFINRILSSMGEGVLVADPAGRIVFANQEAEQLLGVTQAQLMGADLTDFLCAQTKLESHKLRAALSAASGQQLQFDFAMPTAEPRHLSMQLSALLATLRLSATSSDNSNAESAIGVVALLSDITKRVELDRLKTETLQLVSHELRTPLTSIQGLSDVLLKFPVQAAEARAMHETIHAEALRLSETINRYLDLARLESGAQPLHRAPVDCQQMIEDCVRNLSVLAAEQGITLTAQVPPGLPALQADTQLLTHALNNLLSNALKYSPPQTEVIVTAAREQNNILLSVRDQGFGIPVEAHERIFEKFFRLERDAASVAVGTGLGLPLVKEIVERHGGRISVVSAEGQGSTFTLHLPT